MQCSSSEALGLSACTLVATTTLLYSTTRLCIVNLKLINMTGFAPCKLTLSFAVFC